VCLIFSLLDKFGDGWGTGHLVLYNSAGDYITKSPDCATNPAFVDPPYCFNPYTNKAGDWVTAVVFGFWPSEAWEVN